MSELKESWKETGKGLGHAFSSLGKSIVKSVTTGVEKANDWANSPNEPEGGKTDSDSKNGESVNENNQL